MLDQTSAPLLEALQARSHKTDAPFYAPGHKRGGGIDPELAQWWGLPVFAADLPELPELDNLFAPDGAIAQAQELAAAAFKADRTWFLANGSTAGVIAAILATCGHGEKIILPRNIHKSAVSGLILSGAVPIFLTPETLPDWDIPLCITPEAVAAAIQTHPDAKAVFVVSPNYHGICGHIAGIAQIAHQHGIPLIVDEAHGPHFGFHPHLPPSAIEAGADMAVHSTHKVLGAMTQASMLHLRQGMIEPQRVNQALELVQSTSPNYLLLASLDAARRQMAVGGYELMAKTLALAATARSSLTQIPTLEPPAQWTASFAGFDPSRLTVKVTDLGLTGYEADELLQKMGVTAELPSWGHLTFIISLGNTEADIEQLIKSFAQLASVSPRPEVSPVNSWAKAQLQTWSPRLPVSESPRLPVSPRSAFFAAREVVPAERALGRISTEIVCPYPPGIPVLMPGEIISPGAIDFLQQVRSFGGVITGCDPDLQNFSVVR
ncbi:MAG TPA: aminotransferase class I/II-fold pyridoxal phosphate-dependent enzyme [Oscillatoriaceae cyanobacterium M33_DOE_052]|uniref:Aminotransferase class I/II-fold pyridoxal phosphate-dependent enzyme n=1 Tax=Planktothricoides sp. SpSt-374 TaxID=2282167 RepID=A0A7C3ZI97_9CYAN|nr:aminotransferase class I/II-fold pyridoxal phosphate-dependent enzyme [Oscillatoriaceae cyanobacterium M33_DOE_052]